MSLLTRIYLALRYWVALGYTWNLSWAKSKRSVL